MRALANHERLTFKSTPASLAVSRGERSICCLFIGGVSQRLNSSLIGVTPRQAPRGATPHALAYSVYTEGDSGRRTPDCEEKFSLVGGARPKRGLDLLKSRLRTAGNFGQFLYEV